MAMGVDGPINDKQRESIARIRTNQEHLLSLIDDVLNFAKIEAGKSAVDMQTVSLREVVSSVEAALAPQLARRELTLVTNDCDVSLLVRADPVKLRQILVNVLGNSVKFTPPKGRIEMTTERESNSAKVCLTDTGIGIPTEKLDRVFEPFFQVHAGTTRKYAGTGLGLAIARDFARAMGGDLTIESDVDRGCKVTIELALASVTS